MCVSTAIVGCPNAVLRMTLAVLRPTPGSASSASRSAGTWPPCSLDQHPAGGDDVLRLALVQADRLHVTRPARRRPSARIACGVLRDREQLARREVHALVGCLRREDHRDQQFERRRVLELRLRVRIEPRNRSKSSTRCRSFIASTPVAGSRPVPQRRGCCNATAAASARPSSRNAPGWQQLCATAVPLTGKARIAAIASRAPSPARPAVTTRAQEALAQSRPGATCRVPTIRMPPAASRGTKCRGCVVRILAARPSAAQRRP